MIRKLIVAFLLPRLIRFVSRRFGQNGQRRQY